ncbi:MAG TPA: hypothetical protein H9713_08195 [Candidatus Mediterraneibacter surreyensis]|nr:hypothetical protein [Candidatus Mediterraneibacter surreyensis]
MRLIDADRLKSAIHTDFSEHFTLYHDTDQTALFDMVMDDIDEMPTAFDKEKVIEELRSEASRWHESGVEFKDEKEKGVAAGFRLATHIVEKGGIE